MVQHIGIRLNELHQLPHRFDGHHTTVSESVNFLSTDERHLLQFDLLSVVISHSVGAERNDGEHRAVTQAPTLFLGVGVASFKDLLSQTLETMFVQIVVLGFQSGIARATIDKWSGG